MNLVDVGCRLSIVEGDRGSVNVDSSKLDVGSGLETSAVIDVASVSDGRHNQPSK